MNKKYRLIKIYNPKFYFKAINKIRTDRLKLSMRKHNCLKPVRFNKGNSLQIGKDAYEIVSDCNKFIKRIVNGKTEFYVKKTKIYANWDDFINRGDPNKKETNKHGGKYDLEKLNF